MISAVIVTFNEGKKLEECLKSIDSFADEVVVTDLGSTDNTEEVAKKYKAKFIRHGFVPYVELVRNFAVLKTSGNWILVLDPDERIPETLKVKLKEITKQDKYVAVNIPRKNIFFGKWISHTNWWPDKHVRFFIKDKISWTDEIHLYPKVDGEILELEEKEDLAIEHYGYDTIKQFIERQNRYSTIEAKNRYDREERFSLGKFIWWPKREFLVRFIKHRGFMDGFHGFALTFLMMVYKMVVAVKLWESENVKR